MGKILLDQPRCLASLEASANELDSTGVDLLAVLRSDDPEVLQCTLNTIVSITAIQLALVDALTSRSVEVAGIIGHSIGEIAAG
jgi:malonyl CoA-acyl carrier protein transacylase